MHNYTLKSFDYSGDALQIVHCFSDQPHLFFLDSSQLDPNRGRYSFIGFDPVKVIQTSSLDGFNELERIFLKCKDLSSDLRTPLQAGIVGFISCDFGLQLEGITTKFEGVEHGPGCFFGFYDCVITIDHHLKKLYIVVTEVSKYLNITSRPSMDAKLKAIASRLESYFLSKENAMFDPSIDLRMGFQRLNLKSNTNFLLE